MYKMDEMLTQTRNAMFYLFIYFLSSWLNPPLQKWSYSMESLFCCHFCRMLCKIVPALTYDETFSHACRFCLTAYPIMREAVVCVED